LSTAQDKSKNTAQIAVDANRKILHLVFCDLSKIVSMFISGGSLNYVLQPEHIKADTPQTTE
jgi:hypothetical protein